MAERMNRAEVVTVEELLRSCLYEQEALRRLLVRKGLLTDQEILDELQTVRRELEARRGR
jgi:predicted nucleic acid-binding protein